MKDLQQLVERQIMTRRNSDFLWVALLSFVFAVVISGFWDLWEVGMTVGLVLAVACRFLLRHKLKILSEPLVLSSQAVRASFRGDACVYVRGVLGRGRQMAVTDVDAWLVDELGHRTEVRVSWQPRVVVGPWSLILKVSANEGTLFVRVTVSEGSKRHEETGHWVLSEVSEGQFAPMCIWKSGRLWGNAKDWDTLEPCGPSSLQAP